MQIQQAWEETEEDGRPAFLSGSSPGDPAGPDDGSHGPAALGEGFAVRRTNVLYNVTLRQCMFLEEQMKRRRAAWFRGSSRFRRPDG